MNKKIKAAFDEVKAVEELKISTAHFVCEQYNNATKHHRAFSRGYAIAAACLVITISAFSVFFAYSVPVSAISFDTDVTSVELEVNCFGRVVGASYFDENTKAEIEKLKNMSYTDAAALVSDEYGEKDGNAVFFVSGKNSSRCEKIAGQLKCCNPDKTTVDYNYETGRNFFGEANSMGLSTGKYKAYLELKEYEPGITVDEIRGIPMGELKKRIEAYTTEKDTTSEQDQSTTEPSINFHNGNGHNHRNGEG